MQAHLYNQALTHRFGVELRSLLDQGRWASFEFAVAWVRRSGTMQVAQQITRFLRRGGVVRGTVGVDIENTSREGLEGLLELAAAGDAQFWVYHNRNRRTTFHPKMFLFLSAEEGCLIVGSNNLTEAGLYTNTEAGLQVVARRNNGVIMEAQSMLEGWRSGSSSVIRRLTPGFLGDLVGRGYVPSEATLQERRRRSHDTVKEPKGEHALFGSLPVYPPPRGAADALPPADSVGSVLLMRVRRASETSRRTQIQVPIRLTGLGFLEGATGVKSRVSGEVHKFREAHARGGLNTIKLEIPEIGPLGDPVLRFEREEEAIVYTAYDATSVEGRLIMMALETGRRSATTPTVLTAPSRPGSSTWFRFV